MYYRSGVDKDKPIVADTSDKLVKIYTLVGKDLPEVVFLLKMISLPLLFNLVVVTRQDGPCKKTGTAPKVTPYNKNSLKISWEQAFMETCNASNFEHVNIKKVRKGNLENVKELMVNKSDAYIDLNPCLKHILIVEITFNFPYKQRHCNGYTCPIESSPANYNSINDLGMTIYGGLLNDHMQENTCVTNNGPVSLPEMPESLKSCIFGEPVGSLHARVGENWSVTFNVTHPEDSNKARKVEMTIRNIPRCSEDTGLSVGWVARIATGSSVLIIIAISVIIFALLKRSNRSDWEEEANQEYGNYELSMEEDEDGNFQRTNTTRLMDYSPVYRDNDYYGSAQITDKCSDYIVRT